jgi:hypothetical protein
MGKSGTGATTKSSTFAGQVASAALPETSLMRALRFAREWVMRAEQRADRAECDASTLARDWPTRVGNLCSGIEVPGANRHVLRIADDHIIEPDQAETGHGRLPAASAHGRRFRCRACGRNGARGAREECRAIKGALPHANPRQHALNTAPRDERLQSGVRLASRFRVLGSQALKVMSQSVGCNPDAAASLQPFLRASRARAATTALRVNRGCQPRVDSVAFCLSTRSWHMPC